MIESIDLLIFSYLNGYLGRSSTFDTVIFFSASFLPVLIGVLFIILICVSLYRKTNGFEVMSIRLAEVETIKIAFVTILLARSITFLLQHLFGRIRPYATFSTPHLFVVSAWSFPSGHATVLFALVGAAYRFNRNAAAILALLSVVVCVARVSAGVHYPTDVIAGALIGLFVGYMGTIFFRYTETRRKDLVRV